MKPQVSTIVLFLMLLGTIACTDEPVRQQTDNDLFNVKNGFLQFRDQAAYDEVNRLLKEKKSDELDAWERQLSGFTSMRAIFNRALDEEEIFIEKGGKAGEHSPYAVQHMQSLYFPTEDDMRPNLPPTNDMLLAMVNRAGIIQIGSTIFEYKNGSIKEIRDGDESKISLLGNYIKSDLSKNIVVTRITRMDITKAPNPNLKVAYSGNASCNGYTSGGGQRVKGTVELYVSETDLANQTYYHTYVNVYATNQEKKLGVWFNKKTSQLRIVGDVNVGPDWGFFSLDIGTGGGQTSSIGYVYNFQDRLVAFSSYPYLYGSLTFYGRDGSSCSV